MRKYEDMNALLQTLLHGLYAELYDALCEVSGREIER